MNVVFFVCFFLFSQILQILETECKYGKYCTPLSQWDHRYFFVLAINDGIIINNIIFTTLSSILNALVNKYQAYWTLQELLSRLLVNFLSMWIDVKHFFSIWVFFREHSRMTGLQRKREGISLIPLYHSHPLHSHEDISHTITAGNPPLHIASGQARTGNPWFPNASR